MTEEINLSSKYKQFLVSGIFRSIITRIFSIFYVIYITRNVSIQFQDQMVILASIQAISVKIGLFGISYALVQQGIFKNKNFKFFNEIIYSTLLIGSPIILLFGIFTQMYLKLSLVNSIFFISVLFISYIFESLIISSNANLRTDKGVLMKTFYSIFNSILVSSFLFFQENIFSLLLAWVLSFVFAMLIIKSEIISLLKHINLNLKDTFEILKFGLPIYFIGLSLLIVDHVDRFLIYSLFEVGDTASYYWASRISSIFQEFLTTIFIGVIPLFTKLYRKESLTIFLSKINSFLRIIIINSFIFFFIIIINRSYIIEILLSELFLNVSNLLGILLTASYFSIICVLINSTFAAMGNRLYLVIVTVVAVLSKTLGIFIFFEFGIYGLGFAVLFQKAFYLFSHILLFWKKFDQIISYLRSIIFVLLLFLSIFIFNIFLNISSIFYINIVSILVILFFSYLIKPFNSNDIDILLSIISINNIMIKKIFRHISH